MFRKRRVYLDTAAGLAGNASSPHEEGRKAKQMLEAARERIARLVEVKADDVIFTSGATEANALAIVGHVRAVRKGRRNNAHALYLPSAHASIVENMKQLALEGVVVEPLPIHEGRVDVALLATMLTPNTVLVSMDAVCGETGVVWNTREVAETIRGYRISTISASPIRLHVDASQAPLTEKVTRAHFNADLLTFDISKISPERGFGVLVAHRTIPLEPLYRGGGQERGLRPGSETPELAAEFADALARAVDGREVFRVKAQQQRQDLLEQITALVPNVLVNEARLQAPSILNISLLGRDTDYLVALLDDLGFAVSTKSACETDSEEGSRAVLALTVDKERAKATLRISWGPRTRSRDLARFALALAQSLKV
ncbi:MAG: aminotransferase class V-fold PLP-dependent enzyme [Candidatus Paceibacterota bacterium]